MNDKAVATTETPPGTKSERALRYAWTYAILLLIGGRLIVSPELGFQFILGQAVSGLILGAIVSPVIWVIATSFFKRRWEWHSWLNAICYFALLAQLIMSIGGHFVRKSVSDALETTAQASPPISSTNSFPVAASPISTAVDPSTVAITNTNLPIPAKTDDAGWKAYLSDVVLRNMGEITNQPFLYYLPTQADPEFQAKYDRQLEQAKNAIARGIVGGNLIAFGSPESAKMADIAVASFTGVPVDTMKKVKIVFIGDAVDGERVGAAVVPSGADYVFVEAKNP